jgi:hypothetical protein
LLWSLDNRKVAAVVAEARASGRPWNGSLQYLVLCTPLIEDDDAVGILTQAPCFNPWAPACAGVTEWARAEQVNKLVTTMSGAVGLSSGHRPGLGPVGFRDSDSLSVSP